MAKSDTTLSLTLTADTAQRFRLLSETHHLAVPDLAAAALELGVHDLAQRLRVQLADLVESLNGAKTIVINDRNLTLQWHAPGGPELGWMPLEGQNPAELGSFRRHLEGKVGVDLVEFDDAMVALFGNPVNPDRMTKEAVIRRCQQLRDAGYTTAPLPETGISLDDLTPPTG